MSKTRVINKSAPLRSKSVYGRQMKSITSQSRSSSQPKIFAAMHNAPYVRWFVSLSDVNVFFVSLCFPFGSSPFRSVSFVPLYISNRAVTNDRPTSNWPRTFSCFLAEGMGPKTSREENVAGIRAHTKGTRRSGKDSISSNRNTSTLCCTPFFFYFFVGSLFRS